MAEEYKPGNRKNSALEELKRLQQEDRRAGIHYNEPELKHFNAQSVFEVEEEDKKHQKRHAFGKRREKQKGTKVRIASQDLENKEGLEVTDLTFGDEFVEEKPSLKRNQAEQAADTSKTEEKSQDTSNNLEDASKSEEKEQEKPKKDKDILDDALETVQEDQVPAEKEEAAEEPEKEEEPIVLDASSLNDINEVETELDVDEAEIDNLEKEIQSDEANDEIPSENKALKALPEEDIESPVDTDKKEEVLEADDGQQDENDDENDIEVKYYEEEAQDENDGSEQPEVQEVEKADETPTVSKEDDPLFDDFESREFDEDNLYQEKRKFLFSQYVDEQKYLEKKSQQGYHYVKRDGNRFYFVKGDPKDYYYILNYYKEEPGDETKREWARDGWKLITRTPSKNSKDAGWFVLRNEEQRGEYRRTIENEDEKYDFFRKYVNSCRSTLFLIFICMACCVVTAILQISFQGHWIGIAACVVLFVIALIAFFSYLRISRNAKKMSRLLRARLRIRAKEQRMRDDRDESDEELDTEWNLIDK